LDHITHFVQFAELAKPDWPTSCNAFWEGKLALLTFTLNFISSRTLWGVLMSTVVAIVFTVKA
jgi:hypothetical protein